MGWCHWANNPCRQDNLQPHPKTTRHTFQDLQDGIFPAQISSGTFCKEQGNYLLETSINQMCTLIFKPPTPDTRCLLLKAQWPSSAWCQSLLCFRQASVLLMPAAGQLQGTTGLHLCRTNYGAHHLLSLADWALLLPSFPGPQRQAADAHGDSWQASLWE